MDNQQSDDNQGSNSPAPKLLSGFSVVLSGAAVFFNAIAIYWIAPHG